jgi:putative MATE family efflux protein
MHDGTNLGLSLDFMHLRIWGLPFLLITQLLSSFFISVGKSGLLMYGSFVTTFMNILLDYLLIFGHWGFPAMGFNGAAIASVVAEVVYCATMVGMFFGTGLHKTYPVGRYVTVNIQQSIQTLKVAAPLIVQFLFSIGGWLIFFFFIEHLGSKALAGSQMLRSIFGILGVGTWALATTCNTMVSNIIGQGRHHEVAAVVKKIAKLSFSYAVVLGILLLVFPRQFLGLYTADDALITYTIPSLQVIVAATLITSLSTVAFNAVVGTGNTIVNLTMEVTCVGLYLLYCYYFIYLRHAPLYICWGSEFVYWSLLLIGSVVYLRSGRWRAKKI